MVAIAALLLGAVASEGTPPTAGEGLRAELAITFDATSTLHDFSGRAASLDVSVAPESRTGEGPNQRWSAEARVPVLTLETELVVARAYVPAPDRRVGEVRVVRRQDAVIVQTLLYARVLGRVVGEIRKKEAASWPDGTPEHAAMERYVARLTAAADRVWRERLPESDQRSDRRLPLFIEFTRAPLATSVTLGTFTIPDHDRDVEVREPRVYEVLTLASSYVERNMRLIVADAFRVSEARAAELLEEAARAMPQVTPR